MSTNSIYDFRLKQNTIMEFFPFDIRCGMIYGNTGRAIITHAKVAISIDRKTLNQLDTLVKHEVFQNRSKAFQSAITEKLERLEKSRLARECAKLNPDEEKAIAEEGMGENQPDQDTGCRTHRP